MKRIFKKSTAQIETAKRLNLAKQFNKKAKKHSVGIVLVGSVAYAPNENVNADSDVDLIVIYKNVKDCVSNYFKDGAEKDHLLSSNYDGILVKQTIDDVPVSIHNLNADAFEKISSASYSKLVYYRQSPKNMACNGKDFDGTHHSFPSQSTAIEGLKGVRKPDSIAFCVDGKFVMGNDIDKILSNGKILHDTHSFVSKTIDKLWTNVVTKLADHYKNKGDLSALENADISQFLYREQRFSKATKRSLKNRTQKIIKDLKV